MHSLSAARPAPTTDVVFSQWSWQPLALLAIVVAVIWWWRAVAELGRQGQRVHGQRVHGQRDETPSSGRWPVRRTVLFGIGLILFGWVTNGFPQAYARSVFAAWLSQSLLLLLVIPAVLMTAQPVGLARAAYGDRSIITRFVASRLGRIMSSPFVGPAVVPVICTVLFFGSVPGWVAEYQVLGWALALVLTVVGAMIVLPLVSTENDGQGSLAVGVALGVGLFELLIDAVPGIALRLQTNISSSFVDHRIVHSWSVSALTDQQGAGAILWGAAELLDIPFLLLIFRRWVIADARDAAQIDTVLDAERITRSAITPVSVSGLASTQPAGAAPVPADSDEPWWLVDPIIQERLRRQS